MTIINHYPNNNTSQDDFKVDNRGHFRNFQALPRNNILLDNCLIVNNHRNMDKPNYQLLRHVFLQLKRAMKATHVEVAVEIKILTHLVLAIKLNIKQNSMKLLVSFNKI